MGSYQGKALMSAAIDHGDTSVNGRRFTNIYITSACTHRSSKFPFQVQQASLGP